MTNTSKSALRDHLTVTSDESRIDLTEQELHRVTGGKGHGGARPVEYLKIKMNDIIITSVV